MKIAHVKDVIARGAAMLLAVMVSFSTLAEDGPIVLWWQVGQDLFDTPSDIIINTFHQGQQTAESMGVDSARVKVVETGEYLPVVALDYDGSTVETFPVSSPIPGEAYSSLITQYASPEYSFMIELGNWDDNANPQWTMVAMSEVVQYNTLVKDGHIGVWSGTTIEATKPEAWAVSTYTVPEPTGGMLFVIGGALLALRRRRRRDAE